MKNELEINMKLDGEDFLYAAVEVDFNLIMQKLMGLCSNADDTGILKDIEIGDFIDGLKKMEILQDTPSKETLRKVVNNDTTTWYDDKDFIVKTKKETIDDRGNQVIMLTQYDKDQRTTNFIKLINDIQVLEKSYIYNARGSVVEFIYSVSSPKDGSLRAKTIRKYMDNAVYETIINGNNVGYPVKHVYQDCYLDKFGYAIHEITGIRINADNAGHIL